MGQCNLDLMKSLVLIIMIRPQGHCSPEACISRNVWSRYVLGLLSRPRSHVFRQIPPETSRIPWSRSELQAGYRGIDAGYKSFEEGTRAMEITEDRC